MSPEDFLNATRYAHIGGRFVADCGDYRVIVELSDDGWIARRQGRIRREMAPEDFQSGDGKKGSDGNAGQVGQDRASAGTQVEIPIGHRLRRAAPAWPCPGFLRFKLDKSPLDSER